MIAIFILFTVLCLLVTMITDLLNCGLPLKDMQSQSLGAMVKHIGSMIGSLMIMLHRLSVLTLVACLISFNANAGDADDSTSMSAYNKCTANAYSEYEANECSGKALETWDKELNKIYRYVLSDPDNSDETQAKLKQAQRLWLKYRKLNCDYYGSIYAGGTLSRFMYGKCMATMTKARLDELRLRRD